MGADIREVDEGHFEDGWRVRVGVGLEARVGAVVGGDQQGEMKVTSFVGRITSFTESSSGFAELGRVCGTLTAE